MPLYDYECNDCGEISEIAHKISEIGTPQKCLKCNSTNTKKVILTAAKLGDPVRLGITKNDNSWKETLQKIHEQNPGSTLDKVIK